MSISINTQSSIQSSHSVSNQAVIKQIPPEIWVDILEYQDWEYQDLSTIWWVSKSNKLMNVANLVFRQIGTHLASLQKSFETKGVSGEILEEKMIGVVETIIKNTQPLPIKSLHIPAYVFKNNFNQLLLQLPSTIYHLTFRQLSNEYFRFDSSRISLLPLTGLCIHSDVDIGLNWKLPENLTKLRLDSIFFTDNLLRMIVSQLQNGNDCNFSVFPRNLTYLDMGVKGGGNVSEEMKEWIFTQLPASLEHFIVRYEKTESDSESIFSVLDEKLINRLPRSLRSLEFQGITRVQFEGGAASFPEDLERAFHFLNWKRYLKKKCDEI